MTVRLECLRIYIYTYHTVYKFSVYEMYGETLKAETVLRTRFLPIPRANYDKFIILVSRVIRSLKYHSRYEKTKRRQMTLYNVNLLRRENRMIKKNKI